MNATQEEWRPVAGFEGYEASNLGQVRSVDRVITDRNGVRYRRKGRLLTPHLNSSGYPSVKLGKQTTRYVHQVVMWAFIGPTPPGMEVCHNNGICTDNRLENLRYDTHKANVADILQHGVHPNWGKTHCKRGHEFTPENTGRANDRGGRYCKACVNAATRARNARLDPEKEKARLHQSYLRHKEARRARERARYAAAKKRAN